MLALPPEFDSAVFVADIMDCVLPFVPFLLLFVAYKVIKRIAGNVV